MNEAPMGDQQLLRIVCPNCQTALKVSSRRIGEAHRCPSCRFRILIPDPEELEEAQPLSLSTQVGDAPAPALSDDALLAHLHRRRSRLKYEGLGGRGWLARLREESAKRVERAKLAREIRELESLMKVRWVDLGSQSLLEGDPDLKLDDTKRRLREIIARLTETEDRLGLLSGLNGLGLLARDLRRRIAELEAERDCILEETGRAAHRRRRGDPSELKNLDVLQDMLTEHQLRLEELGGAPSDRAEGQAGSAPSRSRSWIRKGIPISIVVIVGSILVWMGYRYVLATFLDPLTVLHLEIPTGWRC